MSILNRRDLMARTSAAFGAAAVMPWYFAPHPAFAQVAGRATSSDGKLVAANPGSFRGAIEAAGPGTVIVLEDGTYGSEKIPLAKQGVVVVAKNPLGAKIPADFDFAGSGNILAGIDMSRESGGGEYTATLGGKGNHVYACKLYRKSGRLIMMDGDGCSIQYCDMSVYGDEVTPSGGGGGFGMISDPQAKGRSNLIHRNYFHDAPRKAKGDYHKFKISGVGVGQNPIQYDVESNLSVIENLFFETGDAEISIKTSKNTIQGNTIAGTSDTKCYGNQRSGNYNKWIANWFGKTGYGASIVVHGGGHEIINNVCESMIALKAGKSRWNQKPSGDSNRVHNSANCIVVGNKAKIVVGHTWSSESLPLPAENHTIGAGQEVEIKKATGTKRGEEMASDYPQAKRLNASDVGLAPFLGGNAVMAQKA